MIFRFLNVQGIAGLVCGVALLGLLLIQKGETRHWKKQAARLEQLYRGEQAAFAGTVANYRAAAEAARAADRKAVEKAEAEQRAINERTAYDYEKRLAAARLSADRLRGQADRAAADPGARRAAPVPGLPAAAGRAAQGPGQDRLSRSERLIATEQAIQLDELIKWVRRQHTVDPNGAAAEAQAAVGKNQPRGPATQAE
jgi:hypothetical protein